MEDFERFHGARAVAEIGESADCRRSRSLTNERWAAAKDVVGAHPAEIADQSLQRRIRHSYPVNIHDGINEAGGVEEWCNRGRLDARMDVRGGGASDGISRSHGGSKLRQGVAAGHRANEQTVCAHCMADQPQRQWQIVDRVERAHRKREVERVVEGPPIVLDQVRIGNIDPFRKCVQALQSFGIPIPDQQCALEPPPEVLNPFHYVVQSTPVQERNGLGVGAGAAKRAQLHVEQLGHDRACALPEHKRQGAMVAGVFGRLARWVLDFALPPRCAGCGTIVDDVHSFCPDCWKGVEFLGDGGCSTCGMPLQATEQRTCGVCLARAPRIARTRAAVAYGDLARGLAIRLKYGRKVAIARTMARYMAPLVGSESERLLVPVPLHRTRLWGRGFNQSALVARELSRRLGIPTDPQALARTRRTPPLKGMSPLQRRKTVAGAFRVRDRQKVAGKTIILIDDVLTTGSTAEACARSLKRAGAARVELVSWARVVKPSQLMR